jgi:hypothetical protein
MLSMDALMLLHLLSTLAHLRFGQIPQLCSISDLISAVGLFMSGDSTMFSCQYWH